MNYLFCFDFILVFSGRGPSRFHHWCNPGKKSSTHIKLIWIKTNLYRKSKYFAVFYHFYCHWQTRSLHINVFFVSRISPLRFHFPHGFIFFFLLTTNTWPEILEWMTSGYDNSAVKDEKYHQIHTAFISCCSCAISLAYYSKPLFFWHILHSNNNQQWQTNRMEQFSTR